MADGSVSRIVRPAASGARPRVFDGRGGFNAVMASREVATDVADLYITPPWGARAGGEIIRSIDPAARSLWECACGPGVMAHGLADYFPTVVQSDAFLYDGNAIFDFLSDGDAPIEADWIATNPPFVELERFITLAWRRARRGVALLMPLRALEGIGRHAVLYGAAPLSRLHVFAERLPMLKGRYDPEASTASAYAWFVFLKPRLERHPGHWRGAAIPPGTRARLERASDQIFACKGASR